jgi:uncharacterized protein YukE
MPKVIVDPSELRQFASALEHAVEEIRSRKSVVSSGFNGLHDHWKDRKETEFEGLFKETMAQLESFLKRSEDYAGFLRRKAKLADGYLKGGY